MPLQKTHVSINVWTSAEKINYSKINTKTMKRIIYILSVAVIFSLLIMSCNKDDQEPQTNEAQNELRVSSSDEECENCCDRSVLSDDITGGESGPVPIANVGDPAAWGQVSFAFCGGTENVDFESQFNSTIAGANGWTVGYLDETQVPYSSDLSTLDCENDVVANINPTADNKIGVDDSPSSPGYFEYTAPGGAVNFIRLVAVWKCCDKTDQIKVYVVKVTDLVAIDNGNGTWSSEVEFDYKCFTCDVKSCPVTPESAGTYQEKVFDEIPEGIIRQKK